MKYGYMFYKKPLIPDMPSRPINLGDPIQSYAVKLLYKEMGIDDADIIPVPRYDMRNYAGEECICVVNTCSTYEELAYDSYFMPPNDKIHAIPFSLHINRDIPEEEKEFYRNCNDVGCRDVYTDQLLTKLGVNSYLTGCLTLTFPRRSRELDKEAKNVFLIDVKSDFKRLIPKHILDDSIELSSIVRFPINTKANRMTDDEAYEFHRQGEERIELLKNSARLVITSRLHVASPCLAMGIPVILTKHDDRFGFIDCFINAYTNWDTDCIDWNPTPIDIEKEKKRIKEAFFDRINLERSKTNLNKMWEDKGLSRNAEYVPQVELALKNDLFFKEKDLKYAVLGIISSVSFFIPDIMKKLYPNSSLICGIDSYVKKEFFERKVIMPREIEKLEQDVIIITAVPGAYKAAERYLGGRRHVIIQGKKATFRNF